MLEIQITCHHCHNTWIGPSPLPRGEECPSCHRDARVCLNCQFYDTSSSHSCREPQAEKVQVKDKANFCGYFSAKIQSPNMLPKAETRSKLESLFRNFESQITDAEEATKHLNLKEQIHAFMQTRKTK